MSGYDDDCEPHAPESLADWVNPDVVYFDIFPVAALPRRVVTVETVPD